MKRIFKNDSWSASRSLGTSLFVILSVIFGMMTISLLYQRSKLLQKIQNLQSATTPNYIVFSMDSSCYDQLKNSTDGVIRMSFKK